MNLTQIAKLFDSLFKGIAVHPAFVQEFYQCIAATGYEEQVRKALIRALMILNTLGTIATRHDGFEVLKGSGGIYSMHLEGKSFNLRVLYGFLPSQEPVLLLCFQERVGNKKTEYAAYTAPAASRLTEMKEGK